MVVISKVLQKIDFYPDLISV